MSAPTASLPLLSHPLSPSSLTLLQKCPRLFRYSYIDHLLWPRDNNPEMLLAARRGEQFHRLVELAQKGMPVEALLPATEAPIPAWWQVFAQSPHLKMPGEVWSEVDLWMERRGIRFKGRLDRLVVAPNQQSFTIVDWKTEHKLPDREKLHRSWQVRLYPLMLCLGGSQLNHGEPIRPEQVRLTIWYVQHPHTPFELIYSQGQLDQDLRDLDRVIDDLGTFAASGFPRTSSMEQCRTCWFATRCYGLIPEDLDPEIASALEGFVRPAPDQD